MWWNDSIEYTTYHSYKLTRSLYTSRQFYLLQKISLNASDKKKYANARLAYTKISARQEIHLLKEFNNKYSYKVGGLCFFDLTLR